MVHHLRPGSNFRISDAATPQFVHGVMCCSCLMFSHWDRDFAFGFKAYQAWNQAWNHISRQGGSLWLHIWIGTSLMPKVVKGHMAFEPSRCISCANWKDLGPSGGYINHIDRWGNSLGVWKVWAVSMSTPAGSVEPGLPLEVRALWT